MDAKLLWTPSQQARDKSNLSHYISWLNKNKGLSFHDYQPLWQWSTDYPKEFWESMWEYFDILHDGEWSEVISSDPMPLAKWFEGE